MKYDIKKNEINKEPEACSREKPGPCVDRWRRLDNGRPKEKESLKPQTHMTSYKTYKTEWVYF